MLFGLGKSSTLRFSRLFAPFFSFNWKRILFVSVVVYLLIFRGQSWENSELSLRVSSLESRETTARVLLSALLCQNRRETLPNGAWCLYANGDRGCVAPGAPLSNDHALADASLASFLKHFFSEFDVLDLGAGLGQYGHFWQLHHARIGRYTAVDGAINVEVFTHGFVKYADLTTPLYMSNLVHDWVFSLEVGEHIPPHATHEFIRNIDRNNRCGAVISWGKPGQGGHGHINLRTTEEITRMFLPLGYAVDNETQAALNAIAHYGWFHGNLIVVRKVGAPSRCLLNSHVYRTFAAKDIEMNEQYECPGYVKKDTWTGY